MKPSWPDTRGADSLFAFEFELVKALDRHGEP